MTNLQVITLSVKAESEPAESIIYVSPDGDDNNAGTEDSPLKSLEAAKAAARTASETGDVEVALRGGEYALSKTLRFTADDGGKNGHKVAWKGYENETPVISGMTDITDWSVYDEDNNIYRASVPNGFNTRQLYINGKKAPRSRNISYSGNTYEHLKRTCELGTASREKQEIYLYRNDVADWKNFENVELHMIMAWTDNVLRLKKYDADKNFEETTVDNGGEGTVSAAAVKIREPENTRLFNRAHPDVTGATLSYRSRSYYYLENAYEFIDEDNEWYLDTTENMIYCKSPAGTDMNSVRVSAPALETLISIDGSRENRVCNLSFENIVFEGSTWTLPSEEGIVGGQASQYVKTSSLDNKVTARHTPSAFYAQYADNLNITGCAFRKTGSTAVDLYEGVTNSSIFGSEVYDAAGNGISVAKFFQDEDTEYHEAYNPADKSEVCENINIINNTVHDTGTEYEGAVAIAAGYPKNLVVAHNEVYNAPYSGISIGFGWTSKDNAMSDNIIFANKVHNVGLVSCDFGAIYTLSKQPRSLCARNYIYDLSEKSWYDYGYTALYFDEQTEGYNIRENLTNNVGSNLWGGGLNFNGCRAKNTAVNNYLNTNSNSSAAVSAIAAEAGIAEGKSCAELEAEAEKYIYDILNPSYDGSNPVSGLYDETASTYTWAFANEEADFSKARSYNTEDETVNLRLVLKSGDYVSGGAGIHFNDKSVGDSGSIQNSRYILIKPAYNGTLSATVAFAGAKGNVKCRLYAYDYGDIDFDGIDETKAGKGGTMATTPDITDENPAVRALNLQGGHTYAIYTYQRASDISALSYKITGGTESNTTPKPDTTLTPKPSATAAPGPNTTPTPKPASTPKPAVKTPTLRVDMTNEKHDILHGSAGFLYGISNEGVPDVNALTPLKPKVLATKGALGTEHPYGDALDVAEEFFQAGGEQVQMYCSNYYGVFGVTATANDYGNVLKTIIAPKVVEWKNEKRAQYSDIDSRIVYIPINEGTPKNGVSGFNEAWKIYYNSIKASDPNATIAGPNDATYRGSGSMKSFLTFCRDNSCLPDIMTWHELQVSCLDTMDDHIADYRSICKTLGIDEKQVVINEYADFTDCGVPGRLVNWISRLEDNEVYGCLPFWHQANNLNDLAANANQGNGAWWVYKWYGDMSGKTLKVTAENTKPEGFYGVAAVDENKRVASVICGGADGDTKIVLENVSESGVFKDADRVRISVDATYFNGYHGAAYEPETVLDGVFPVKNGAVEIDLKDNLFSTAYKITVTETTEAVKSPTVGKYRAEYEAENAVLLGNLTLDRQESPIESPKYYCSGGVRVGGIDSEGDGIEYSIDVPVDGLYKLSFIYGNGVGSTRNNAQTHKPLNISQKLVIDGDESVMNLPNTLFYSMEGLAEKYVNLKAGHHKIALMYSGDAGAFHDALYVSREGALDKERPAHNRIYQAESADFNTLGNTVETTARTETFIDGFTGNGYVTGLSSSPVENGGGIRRIVDVEESGMYHLIFRYASEESGNIRVYLDNTNLTYNNKITEIAIAPSDGWAEAYDTVFLRQGINIIDIDTDCKAAIDYMRVLKSNIDLSRTIEAEGGAGKFETAKSGDTTYVTEMLANDGSLEFKVTVPADGTYKMRVFQSNNDLCGTHSYNIKIIDRYASFDVNNEKGERYFFPNTFSDDTFLERVIPIKLKAGENTIKVYNDDSWHVLWGGSTSKPGTNELINYTPNFDKFIISPQRADAEIGEMQYLVNVSSTGGGYVYCDRNTAAKGEDITIYLVPDGKIKSVSANGRDITDMFTTDDGDIYTARITAEGDTSVYAEFAPAREGAYDEPRIDIPDTVTFGGRTYKTVGDNLFTNGDFSDNSGNNMNQWHVGANINGHPTGGNDFRPVINADGTLENLTPLSESGLLINGSYEPSHSGNKFYFGQDNTQPEELRHYLVEAIGEPWQSNAWNGADSLLAYTPVKPNTKYYFKFSAYTSKGSASIRYGAINMSDYVPDTYKTTDTLNFSGSGYMACKNGDQQNVGGAWKRYESVINSGNGDYFLFNAYWLHMCEYLCMGDFELIEIEPEPLTKITGAEKLPTITIAAGETLALPETVNVFTETGERVNMPVVWLNSAAVNASVSGVYAVTGYINPPDGYSFDDIIYVRQRVVINPNGAEPYIVIDNINRSESGIAVSARVENPTAATDAGTFIIAVYDENNNCEQVKTAIDGTAEFEKIDNGTIRVFLWSGLSGDNSMKPLLPCASENL